MEYKPFRYDVLKELNRIKKSAGGHFTRGAFYDQGNIKFVYLRLRTSSLKTTALMDDAKPYADLVRYLHVQSLNLGVEVLMRAILMRRKHSTSTYLSTKIW